MDKQSGTISRGVIGHSSAVWAVAFSPDGRTLATAGSDRTAVLWDVADRQAPRPLGDPLAHYDDQVFSVAFARDGATLATAGRGAGVILWDLARLGELRTNAMERACRVAGTGLSRDEWAQDVPGVPYEETCSR